MPRCETMPDPVWHRDVLQLVAPAVVCGLHALHQRLYLSSTPTVPVTCCTRHTFCSTSWL